MKKLLTFAAGLLIATAMMAQQPVITFTKTQHDFGKINEADGRVTTIFEFKNEGMAPLVLSNVRASCGCTTPKWPREPIEPGQVGQITVTYNPNGRPGRFQKTITVTSNAAEATIRLYIKGEVIPKSAKPVDNYPVKIGDLSLKTKVLDFGNIVNTTPHVNSIVYANQSGKTITVDCKSEAAFVAAQATLAEVENKKAGQFDVAFGADRCNTYGPVETKLYVIVNGELQKEPLTIKANIVEDFSRLSEEERRLTPIVEVASQIDLGTIAKGKKVKKNLAIRNAGERPMYIRRVYTSLEQGLKFTTPKSVKNNRNGSIGIEINTANMEAGNYSAEMTIITNDCKNSVVKVQCNWTVQ